MILLKNLPETLIEKIEDAVQDKINELENVIVNSDDVETILEVSKDILDLKTIKEIDEDYENSDIGKEDLKGMLEDINNGKIISIEGYWDEYSDCPAIKINSREPFEIKDDNVTKDEDDGDDSPTYDGEDEAEGDEEYNVDNENNYEVDDDDDSESVDNEGDW